MSVGAAFTFSFSAASAPAPDPAAVLAEAVAARTPGWSTTASSSAFSLTPSTTTTTTTSPSASASPFGFGFGGTSASSVGGFSFGTGSGFSSFPASTSTSTSHSATATTSTASGAGAAAAAASSAPATRKDQRTAERAALTGRTIALAELGAGPGERLSESKGRVSAFASLGGVMVPPTSPPLPPTTALAKHLAKFVATDTYSDVSMVVGGGEGKRIPGHRIILSAASTVLDQAIARAAETSPGSPPMISIAEVEPSVWMGVLQAIYTDQVSSADATFLSAMLKAAQDYKIEFLVDRCNKTLKKQINVASAFTFLENPSLSSQPFVTDYIDKHITQLVAREGFLTLSEPSLVMILKSPTLLVGEGKLWSRTVTWAQRECGRRTPPLDPTPENLRLVMTRLIPLFRFPTLTMDEFVELVAPLNILTSDEMLELFTYVGAKGTGAETTTSFITEARGLATPGATGSKISPFAFTLPTTSAPFTF